MLAKKLINRPADVVKESLEGVLALNTNVVLLEGHDVILRADYEHIRQRQVTVLSGGGSGHEPSFAGFVGSGGLTAAVAGGVFASPSAAAALAAIRAVCGPPGCLVVIMNYTGDRLHFGKAVEQAKAEGYRVRMVVIADDCALPKDKGITGRRGVAGTLLVQKIACAAADAQLDLDAVATEALHSAEQMGTLGVALTGCTLPGQPLNDRLPADKIEIGLGIHGEAGIRQGLLMSADEVVEEALAAIIGVAGEAEDSAAFLPVGAGQEVVLFVNNLGATPPLEMSIVARSAIRYLKERGLKVARAICGRMMTSLDMAGVSLTVMKVTDPLLLTRLDAPTDVAPWRGASVSKWPETVAQRVAAVTKRPETDVLTVEHRVVSPGREKAVAAAIRAAAQAVQALEPELTRWDATAGDGDAGVTFHKGAKAVLALLDEKHLPLSDLADLLLVLGEVLGEAMGGTSGAILEIFFTAGAGHVRATGEGWAGAFAAGASAVETYGGARVGMKTMVDALSPAAAVFEKGGDFAEAAAAADSGARNTLGMDAMAGRANWISPEQVRTVPDPGAMAIATAMLAALQAVQG